MKVVLVNYGHFPEHRTPGAVLDAFPTLTGWARGLSRAGLTVVAVQGFCAEGRLRRDNVDYEFVPGAYAPQLARWRIPRRLFGVVRKHEPDLVHLNGLGYGVQARALRYVLPGSTVLVAQHHAERPGRGWRAVVERWGLRKIDGAIFTGLDSAGPWLAAGTLGSGHTLFEIAEGSTDFRLHDRQASRLDSGFSGDPIFTWLGNLDSNKDPLVVLTAFETFAFECPDARLYMAFRGTELLPRVEERVAESQALRSSVRLLGHLPASRVELLLNCSDFFVQGSHREGSGYALIEALACGAVPIVTDIPAFRFLTRGGELGPLWPPGDHRALLDCLRKAQRLRTEGWRRRIRRFFESDLSFGAIGRQAASAYEELLRERRS